MSAALSTVGYGFTDALRQVTVLALALLQFFSPQLFYGSGGFYSQENAIGRLPPVQTPIEPAGYAFIIWILIYIGAVIFATYHAWPANGADPVLRRIGWPVAVSFAACSLWNLAAGQGPVWATVPIIFAISLPLILALIIAERSSANLWVTLPIALYAGWVTVASAANPLTVLPAYGAPFEGLASPAWAAAAIGVATLVAAYTLFASGGNLVYGLAVVWGLTAIIVANLSRSYGDQAVIVAAGIAIALVIGCLVSGRLLSTRPVE